LKVSLFLILLAIQSNLFAQNYCIFIDKLTLNTNANSKIQSILDDIAYPSIKINQNIIFIYSGKFKNAADANKLLPLTKSRYKHAKVSVCRGTKLYKHPSQLSLKKPKMEKKTVDNLNYYCLEVFKSSLGQSSKQKDKIKSILDKLPQTHTKVINGNFLIYSGDFSTKKSADTILIYSKKSSKALKSQHVKEIR